MPTGEPLTCEKWAPCECGHFEPLADGQATCGSCGVLIQKQLTGDLQAWVQVSISCIQRLTGSL